LALQLLSTPPGDEHGRAFTGLHAQLDEDSDEDSGVDIESSARAGAGTAVGTGKRQHRSPASLATSVTSALSSVRRSDGLTSPVSPSTSTPPSSTPSTEHAIDGTVPVDMPRRMSGDEMQARLTEVSENPGGRRKRLLEGHESSLLHSLLALQGLRDAGAVPAPATPQNKATAHFVRRVLCVVCQAECRGRVLCVVVFDFSDLVCAGDRGDGDGGVLAVVYRHGCGCQR
jgi:hypothetical protein